jgi:transposase
MANHLTMALCDTIHTLRRRGWSKRRIARELGIDRATVTRHLQTPPVESNAAIAPIGSAEPPGQSNAAIAPIGPVGPSEESNAATAPTSSLAVAGRTPPPLIPAGGVADLFVAAEVSVLDSRSGRASECLPWRDVIVTKLDLGLSAQRIFQDLVAEHGYAGSYYSVRRFVRRLEQSTPLPFRRLECGPGEEAQVDFGLGAPVITVEGRRRRPYVLRIVLSHSRKAYSEVVYRQTTDNFLGCVENAFWAFGGACQRLVLDNPKVRAFADYFGIALLPTRPYTPRHKGKVERGVDYVQENALKGRTFSSLEEENAFLRHWEQTVADTRVHGTTRQQVGKIFADVERPTLVPLPAGRFPFFHEGQRSVHRDGHVEVDKAYYSVPPEYLGRRVWVRWDSRLVRILNDRLEPIAVHVKREPGRFSTQSVHIVAEKISSVERGAAWLLGQVRRFGPASTRWAEAVIQTRGIEGVRVLQGLLSLAKRHAVEQLEQACAIAQSYGSYRLKTVRALIDRHAPKQEQFAFAEEHPLIRPLAEYTQFVHVSFQKEVPS